MPRTNMKNEINRQGARFARSQPSLARRPGFGTPRPAHPCAGARRDEDTLSVFVCFRLALAVQNHFLFLVFLK